MTDKDSIFIITGESSGELYGARLARQLRELRGSVRISGVGGGIMRSEGVEMISGITGAFGLTEALSSLKSLSETFLRVSDELERRRPSVVVLIDFPDFNLKVAERARTLGIKALYYVSPQVWAWRKRRIRRIVGLADRIAVLLPFEEDIYRAQGAGCEFVGHPVMEEIEECGRRSREQIKEEIGVDSQSAVLALLPGSRRSELKRLLPLYLGVVSSFKVRHPAYQYLLPVAPNLDISPFRGILNELEGLGVILTEGRAVDVLSVSDIGLVASGTATLQAALIGVPMVVVYKLFPLTYLIGRMLINVKHISLVNLLSEREVVRELIQGEANPEDTLTELERIMIDNNWRGMMLESYERIRTTYRGKRPSRRVAEIVGELAGW